ncbi:MAG: ABC transporter ATP-binding protein [Elusimicrobia bacterium]|nr:ABC transporter ATP-binding protein [Elusimicrobiota bacterium]
MAEVQVRDVRKSFESGKTVLDRIAFTVKDGEFVSLLGASGCGKTTLLRIIAGLEFADSGAILIEGQDVAHRPPKDRDIAMVFQNYALYPHLSVFENIGMGLKLRKFPEAETRGRVEEAAKMLGLSELLSRRPSALSGGQRQRVALARALVRRPKVFLLDEPLSNLDAVLRERTRGELKLLFKRVKGTVIYVTHDQIEAMTLSDRIVVLDRGLIQQVGTPEEIYHRPANTFVATFLGAPPMNLLGAAELKRSGLASALSEDCLVGIRPESIEVSPEARPGFIEAAVALAEPTGAATVLSLDMGGAQLRASVPGSWDLRYPKAWVSCPASACHYFNENTRVRLTNPAVSTRSE